VRAIHAVLIGGMLGVVLFFSLPVLIGLPIYVLTHSGKADWHALGHRLSDMMSPVDEWLWERPLEFSYSIGNGVGGDTLVADVVSTLVLYGLPALVGAVIGLAAWGVRRLPRRKK